MAGRGPPARRPWSRMPLATWADARPQRRSRALGDALRRGSGSPLEAPPRPAVAPPARRSAHGRRAGRRRRAGAGRGRSAIIVVPDYRDQEQLEAAFDGVVARGRARALRRASADPERYRGFLRTLGEAPCIVIGNRSAVYAPVHDLGLLAIWDDGDPLLEEPLAPYVHPRDAALVRQELDGGALLFAGTPARPMSNGSSPSAGCARSPRTRRGAEGRAERLHGGRVAGGARALGGLPGGARGARDGPGAGAGRAARVLAGAGLRRLPQAGALPRVRRAPARARPAAVPVCGWCGRAAHGLGVPALRVHQAAARLRPAASAPPTSSGGLPGRARDRRRRRPSGHRASMPGPRSSSRPGAPSRSPTAATAPSSCSTATGCCWPNRCASASRACAGGRTPPPSRRPARRCTSWASTGAGRARARHVDPARLRARRTRRPRAAADAARLPRRARRGDAGRGRPAPSRPSARPCPRSPPRRCSGRSRRGAGPDVPHARALVRFDYASGSAVTASLRVLGRRGGAAVPPRGEGPHAAEYTQSAGRRRRPGTVRSVRRGDRGGVVRLIFAGTPEPAVPSLRVLAASDHDIAAVVTRPDAPLGRKRVLTPSPVAAAAEELGLTGSRPPGSMTRRRRSSRRWRPNSASSSPTAGSCASRCSPRPSTAGSTCTSRCCRAGAAPRPCSTR